MGRLDGRAAVITGAGDGIGEGVAGRFAAEGARVLVSDINESSTHRVAESLPTEFGADAHPLTTDVRDKAEVLAMIATAAERFGTVDILVNNAWGGGALGRVEHKTHQLLAHGMSVAYYGPFWVMTTGGHGSSGAVATVPTS